MATIPWSPLATRASKPRDVKNRARPLGVLVHTTGSGIVDAAKRAKTDPLEVATSFYCSKENNFAHYLIGWDGTIIQIAAETEKAWQAAWEPWEEQAYKDKTWSRKWAKDYKDQVTEVPPTFYKSWFSRWPKFKSPVELLERIGGPRTTPNSAFIGIELLDKKPFTLEQYDSLAKLAIDIGIRWYIPFTYDGIQDLPPFTATLPTPFMCGHEDVCPARRYKKRSKETGIGWDPGENFSWPTLLSRVNSWSVEDLSKWYPPARPKK